MAHRKSTQDPKTLADGPFGPRNLAEVYRNIETSPEIADALRKRLLWAYRALAWTHRAVDEEPVFDTLARIPANIPLLRSYLKKAHAVRAEYAESTWRNIRKDILHGLRLSGVKVRQGRKRLPLRPDWQVQIDATTERQRMVLHPFARWNIEEGRSPFEVCQASFDGYEAYINGFDGRESRRGCFLAVCAAWNDAGKTVSDWPPFRVEVKSLRDDYLLDWDEFAPSYKEDVDSALHAAMNPDPLSERRRKRINARTARHQRYQFQRIASALCRQTNRAPKTITTIADVVDPTAAREALRFLIARMHKKQIAQARRQGSPSKK